MIYELTVYGYYGGYTMKIKKKCPFCSNVTEVEVKDADMRKYEGGMLVQRAFPYLTSMQRDVIVNGTCYECSEKMYNIPAPGHEELFGKRIGECACCGRAVWEKDIKDGVFECGSCHQDEYDEYE
mgnify:CR=1 FL=1